MILREDWSLNMVVFHQRFQWTYSSQNKITFSHRLPTTMFVSDGSEKHLPKMGHTHSELLLSLTAVHKRPTHGLHSIWAAVQGAKCTKFSPQNKSTNTHVREDTAGKKRGSKRDKNLSGLFHNNLSELFVHVKPLPHIGQFPCTQKKPHCTVRLHNTHFTMLTKSAMVSVSATPNLRQKCW